MGFREAIQTCFKKYFNPHGRATRSEFWWFFLFYTLATFASIIVSVAIALTTDEDSIIGWAMLGILVLIPPLLMVAIRRLHDKGLTGWVLLLVVVPFGQIAILILCALPGDAGANAHGPDPLDRRSAPKPETGLSPSNIPRVEDDG